MYLIAGPCAAESKDLCLRVAEEVERVAYSLDMAPVFKASCKKANRTKWGAYRGPGFLNGINWLLAVRDQFGIPVTTDIHEVYDLKHFPDSAFIAQIPAFLCKQTPLLEAAAPHFESINIKKGQFATAADMVAAVEKVEAIGTALVGVTERGSCFGKGDLVVDFRDVVAMKEAGLKVFFDATHSATDRKYVKPLIQAAKAVGVDGIFIETHPDPDNALCDGDKMIPLDQLGDILD